MIAVAVPRSCGCAGWAARVVVPTKNKNHGVVLSSQQQWTTRTTATAMLLLPQGNAPFPLSSRGGFQNHVRRFLVSSSASSNQGHEEITTRRARFIKLHQSPDIYRWISGDRVFAMDQKSPFWNLQDVASKVYGYSSQQQVHFSWRRPDCSCLVIVDDMDLVEAYELSCNEKEDSFNIDVVVDPSCNKKDDNSNSLSRSGDVVEASTADDTNLLLTTAAKETTYNNDDMDQTTALITLDDEQPHSSALLESTKSGVEEKETVISSSSGKPVSLVLGDKVYCSAMEIEALVAAPLSEILGILAVNGRCYQLATGCMVDEHDRSKSWNDLVHNIENQTNTALLQIGSDHVALTQAWQKFQTSNHKEKADTTHLSVTASYDEQQLTSVLNQLQRYEAAWMKRYNELVQYKRENGNCDVPQRYYSNRQLGQWVKWQRRAYKHLKAGRSSSMTLKRIQLLDRIGFTWDMRTCTAGRD
ncbi:hypothetical protein ACA910_010385 [Epithemia clementina (nom. ined.)]